MERVRWRLVSLIAWLTLFFNIERLDFDIGGFDAIDLPTSVYIVGVLAAIAAVMPFFQQRHVGLLMVLSIASYIAVLVSTGAPILGGVHTYLTFTSVFMLVITVLLAYAMGRSMSEFLAAVEEITFSSKGGRLRAEQEAGDLVHMEMISSRRSQRPVSLVMLQADASSMNMLMHRLVQEIQRSMMQRYLMATIARVLTRYLRRTDIIIEAAQPGRLMLLAPETSAEDAQALGERLKQIAQERLGVDANYSIATFPQQALTYEELVNVASQRLRDNASTSGTAEHDDELGRLAEQIAQDGPTPIATPVEAKL